MFPMYVGVILATELELSERESVPHVCGGDPLSDDPRCSKARCSPCMWG